MCSSSREEIQAVLDALEADMDRACELTFDVLTTPERLRLLEHFEQVRRLLPVPEHALINQLGEQSDSAELGGKLPHVLADRLRITGKEARQRVDEAADLGPRHALTGQQLPPLLPATAAAQREAKIGAAHVQVIRRFFKQLPSVVDVGTRECAEQQLAQLATQFGPDAFAEQARELDLYLNPDGNFSDEDRARRRGLTLGKQGPNGMSHISGDLTPEARAALEAVLAKLAAPGMCNPNDDTPVIDGAPAEDAVQRDTRTEAQRNHDALLAGCRGLLASGDLGQHNGLPASIIVTTTLKDLEAAAGTAITGGGTRVPMRDVIRMARHAHHYLASAP